MAFSAHKKEDEVTEYITEGEALEKQIKELGNAIRKSKHMVAFTGAGISTSAGIPDFRGPQGVWTLRAQGKNAKAKTRTVAALPTPTHMALVALQKAGYLKFLISQNCDGIHRRSGFPPEALAELHGNTNLEKCRSCGQDYLREYGCHGRNARDHRTGRSCTKCGGELHDSIINFGENLPEKPLRDGFAHSRQSDLMLVMGSSLRVTPACDMPKEAAERGAKLSIVNMQKTPLDPMSKIRVFAKTDEVMLGVMKALSLDIPSWCIRRYFKVTVLTSSRSDLNVTVTGKDYDDKPASIFTNVKITCGNETMESNTEPFEFKGISYQPEKQMMLTLDFLGYFGEPAAVIPIDLGGQTEGNKFVYEKTYSLSMDISKGVWDVQTT